MTFSMIVLFFVLMVVAIFISVVLYIQFQKRTAGETKTQVMDLAARQENAVWASATLLNAQGGLVGGDGGAAGWARYELSLEVTAPGGAPYQASANWMVEVTQLSMLQPGQQLSVRIDQQDPSIIHPNAAWAKFISPG
jgi:hypothetical protein